MIVKVFYLLRMSNDYCFRSMPEKWDPGPQSGTWDTGLLSWTLRWDPKVGP